MKKWRISDILDAMNREKPNRSFQMIADDLRGFSRNPQNARLVIGHRWNMTLPMALGMATATTPERIDVVAARLVAEAERLNVPRRG